MTSGAPDYYIFGELIKLIERIELIDLITLIETINTIKEIAAITNIANVESVDLIDEITNIANIESIDLIDKITLIDAITNIDLIDRITLIDEITDIGTIDTITNIVNIADNVAPRPLTSRRRAGRVFITDTFEDYYELPSEKWKLGGDTDYAHELATDYPLNGATCLKMTTGASANRLVTVWKYFGTFPKSKFGFEINVNSMIGATAFQKLYILMSYHDGTNTLISGIQWLGEANKKFQYYDSNGNWQDVTDGAYDMEVEATTRQPVYHNWKLIVDFENNLYVKFLCNEKEYDLSALAIQSTGAVDKFLVEIQISFGTATDAANAIRIDDVVVTDQEP